MVQHEKSQNARIMLAGNKLFLFTKNSWSWNDNQAYTLILLMISSTQLVTRRNDSG